MPMSIDHSPERFVYLKSIHLGSNEIATDGSLVLLNPDKRYVRSHVQWDVDIVPLYDPTRFAEGIEDGEGAGVTVCPVVD